MNVNVRSAWGLIGLALWGFSERKKGREELLRFSIFSHLFFFLGIINDLAELG